MAKIERSNGTNQPSVNPTNDKTQSKTSFAPFSPTGTAKSLKGRVSKQENVDNRINDLCKKKI